MYRMERRYLGADYERSSLADYGDEELIEECELRRELMLDSLSDLDEEFANEMIRKPSSQIFVRLAQSDLVCRGRLFSMVLSRTKVYKYFLMRSSTIYPHLLMCLMLTVWRSRASYR